MPNPSRIYEGCAEGHHWMVTVSEGHLGCKMLAPRHDLANHSPDGFAWGYGGSGPAQLSLALLADALGSDARAKRLYMSFKFRHVAQWPQDQDWSISANIVRQLAERLERDMAREINKLQMPEDDLSDKDGKMSGIGDV